MDKPEAKRCMHCGGAVDEHGMAMGGEVESSGFDIDEPDEGDESPQMDESEEMSAKSRRAFIRAVRARGVR